MKSNKRAKEDGERQAPEGELRSSGRRALLGRLFAAMGAGAAALGAGLGVARRRDRRDRRELELHEADFYSPHDLAG